MSLVRFPVAPQNERELQQCNSFFITLCICCKTVGRNSTPDYAAGQTIRPRKRFPAYRSGSRKKYEGKTGIGLNDYFCIGIELGNAQNGTVDLGRFSLDNMESVTLYNGQK